MRYSVLILLTFISMSCHLGQYATNPFVIDLAIPAPEDSAGGLVAADLDGDGERDYLITVPGHVAAYAHHGQLLWKHEVALCVGGSSEREGLPGHHGPGVAVAELDGVATVFYLSKDSQLHAVRGTDGAALWEMALTVPEGAEKWEHLAIANLRGAGHRDLVVQATNATGYRMGRYLAAYSLDDLAAGKEAPLWTRDDYWACAHNGIRIADLNGDGLDEIIGPMLLNAQGATLASVPMRGHADSVFVQDVQPERPGLEVVVLEEGGEEGNRIFLMAMEGLIWETHYQHWEPQNAAVGDFDSSRAGLEIWCRSRFNTHQQPFVFDAQGELIHHYAMDDVAPADWTAEGVETIWTIDWTGIGQYAAAKERHCAGKICLFNARTGAFVQVWETAADRLYVADVSGDWREELVVLRGQRIEIYHNGELNPCPVRRPLWCNDAYWHSKQSYNYYSP